MAQTTKAKSTARSKSTNGSKPKASGGGTTKKSTAKRSTSNGSAPKSRSTAKKGSAKSRSSAKPKSRARSTPANAGPDSIIGVAVEKTKVAGSAVSNAASKAKTPLIAGGTALAGAAAGAVIKSKLGAKRSKNPLKRLGGVSVPRPKGKLDLGKVDLKSVKSAAERVSAYGQQASDIAAAVEKTQKKNG